MLTSFIEDKISHKLPPRRLYVISWKKLGATMPFVFSEEELDQLAENLCNRILPNLIEALKKKSTIKAKMLPPNLMSVEELAERLNASNKWIYRKVKEGAIPSKRAGKFLRFERSEIETMLREGRLF